VFEQNKIEWLKHLCVYLLLALVSATFATKHIYVLIWLPAGFSIYLMIRSNRSTTFLVFLGGSLSYGTIMLLYRGGLPPLFPMAAAMLVFGLVEMLNGATGKYFYQKLNGKISDSGGAKLLRLLFEAILLPSLLAGFLLSFARFNPLSLNYKLILSQWLALSMSYFLGSSLVLPFFFYYHREKTRFRALIKMEMRWTAFAMLILTLVIGIYVWPNAIVISILMGLVLVPYINATFGSGIVILICLGMANSTIVHTQVIWSQATLWTVYSELFLKIITVLWGMHLIIGILQEKHIVVATLEEVIEDRSAKLAICMERVDELIAFDQLTGTLNRKAFMERGALEIQRTKRYKRDLTLLHIDIDGLKSINDTHGYERGDDLIVAIAKICEENLRNSDVIARIAGDEFGILMPETTEVDAVFVAEKIRNAVMGYSMKKGDKAIQTTISIGVTACLDEMEQCMVSADTALYRAKKAGRNNVSLSSGQ
jgi:diguanylate cyclase (GGDEF)-like protein